MDASGADPGTLMAYDFGNAPVRDKVTFGLTKNSSSGEEKGLLFLVYRCGDMVGYHIVHDMR